MEKEDCEKECCSTSNGFLDRVQAKVASRKLLVFLVATGMVVFSHLDAASWGTIAMCYIGGQSAIDLMKVWRS